MVVGIDDAAAGVAFVSLAFQCLNGCIAGYKLLNIALHLGQHAAHFHCALLLEESRLLSWAKQSGLADERLIQGLNANVVREVLGNLEILLCDTENLRKKYNFDIKFGTPGQGTQAFSDYDPMTSADFGFLVQDDVRKERGKIIARGKAIQKKAPLHKQFWFAAVDKARFKELIDDIDFLLTGLQDLLSSVKQVRMEADMHFQRLQSINMANKLADIQQLIEGLTVTGAQEARLAALKHIQITNNAVTPKGDHTEAKGLQLLLRQKPSSIRSTIEPILGKFGEERPTPIGKSDLHSSRTYEGRRVYTERKSYQWAAQHGELEEKVKENIASLALLLNAPKMTNFRTLHCIGLLEDKQSPSFQLIYNWPINADPDTAPQSLKDYLDESKSMMPSLTDRLRLAREVASSIFLFHTADWYHKNICSDNVLFFSADEKPPETFDSPYIVGFEYSRPATKDSWPYDKNPEYDIYRHPKYMAIGELGYHRAYDIYSLGLVLLEIVRWRPLKYVYLNFAWEKYVADAKAKAASGNSREVVKGKRHRREEEIVRLETSFMEDEGCAYREDMRKKLLAHDGAADTAFRAGTVMKDVIMFCLGNELDDINEADALQQAYYENVIRPLASCQI